MKISTIATFPLKYTKTIKSSKALSGINWQLKRPCLPKTSLLDLLNRTAATKSGSWLFWKFTFEMAFFQAVLQSWTEFSCLIALNGLCSKRIHSGGRQTDQYKIKRLRSHQRLQMFSSKLMVKTLMLPRRWSKFLSLFWDTLCPLLQSFC